MTPIEKDGYLYGVSGRHQREQKFCLNEIRKSDVEEPIGWQAEIGGRQINLQLFRASMWAEDRFLCLSEFGSLVRAEFSSQGWEIEQCAQLFFLLRHGRFRP